jgi:hypothetical protein
MSWSVCRHFQKTIHSDFIFGYSFWQEQKFKRIIGGKFIIAFWQELELKKNPNSKAWIFLKYLKILNSQDSTDHPSLIAHPPPTLGIHNHDVPHPPTSAYS